MITLVYHKKFKKITEIIINCCIIAITEVYNNEGYDEYNKQNFSSAINFYTEWIKVNCKDKELNAKLYSNRATAHLDLGKKLLVNFLKIFKCIGFVRTVFVRTVKQGVSVTYF